MRGLSLLVAMDNLLYVGDTKAIFSLHTNQFTLLNVKFKNKHNNVPPTSARHRLAHIWPREASPFIKIRRTHENKLNNKHSLVARRDEFNELNEIDHHRHHLSRNI